MIIKAFLAAFGVSFGCSAWLNGAALAQAGDSRDAARRTAAQSAAPAPETSGEISYDAQITGVNDSALKTKLEALSELLTRRKEPPLSRLALERRAAGDEERLKEALQSEGYYGATLHTRIDFGAAPPNVILDIVPGPLYKIVAFDVTYTEQPARHDADLPRDGAAAGLPVGSAAKAADVLAAEARVLDRVHKDGYPLARMVDRKFVVEPATATMRVALTIDQNGNEGGKWRFGAVAIEGLDAVDRDFVERKVTWRAGEPFDLAVLNKYRQTLEGTGLFEFVRVEPVETPPPDTDQLPVIVTVKERKHRTIGLGANYSTSDGPGVKVYWQNRNFNGKGRRIDLTLTSATIRQSFVAGYRRPEFLRDDQAFFTSAEIFHEDNDAYEQVGFDGSAGVDRKITPHLSLSGAGEFEITRTQESNMRTNSQLLTFPVIANYDTTDSYLDATKGLRARLRVAPSSGNNDGPVSFLTVETTASTYFGILKNPETVIAVRGRLGIITGEDTRAIPANRRFYAGGGGSIRGYSYKNVGPRDSSGNPTGGRSVAELGVEARIRVTDTIGIVPFLEGGNAYDDSIDTFGSDFQWGAGLGVRYYTPIGPLRVDFAVPLNRRDNIDDAFQIYVSIGQAF